MVHRDNNDRLFPELDDDQNMSSSARRVASKIAELGVRKIFLGGRFTAHSKLRTISRLGSEFIDVGTSSQTQICVSCDDFSVWSFAYGRSPWFVNSTYVLFDEAMNMVESMQLDDAEVADMDGFARLGDSVRDALRAIDPDSVGDNTFWNELVWDIRVGNFGNVLDIDDSSSG